MTEPEASNFPVAPSIREVAAAYSEVSAYNKEHGSLERLRKEQLNSVHAA